MCSDLSTNESLISVRTSNIKMHIEYFFSKYFFQEISSGILSDWQTVVGFDSLRPINNLSVKQGRVFLG